MTLASRDPRVICAMTTTRSTRATLLVLPCLVAFAASVRNIRPPPPVTQLRTHLSRASQDDAAATKTVSRAEGSRPARGSGMFDSPGADAAGADVQAQTADGDTASAEWMATTAAVAADMRAHLGRRQKVRALARRWTAQ